jgi:hypothetical protein
MALWASTSAIPWRIARPSTVPATAAPAAAGRNEKTLYQPNNRTVLREPAAAGSRACSIGANGPASCPLGLSVPSTAPARRSQRLSAVASRIPPSAMSGAVAAMTRAGPHRAAIVDKTSVRSASSTIVAVNTRPISAAPKPRAAR